MSKWCQRSLFIYTWIIKTITWRSESYFAYLFFNSCTVNKNFEQKKQNLEILKQFAFCKCLEHSIETFGKIDSSEVGSGEVINLMDANKLYPKKIEPIFDSLSIAIIQKQIKNKYDSTNKSDAALGKTSYIFSCIEFYNSKRLDSFVKLLPEDSYIVR